MILALSMPSGIEFLVVSLFSMMNFVIPFVCIFLILRVRKLLKEMDTLQQKVAKLEQQDLKKSE